MKKILLKSLITASVIELAGAIINLISYFADGTFILAKKLYGGECVEQCGFGLLLTRIYPMDTAHDTHAGSTRISIDMPSLLFTLAAGFAAAFIVFLILHIVKKEKE